MSTQTKYASSEAKLGSLSLQKKLLLTGALLLFIRAGSVIPLPFVNQDYMKTLLGGEGFGFLNSITGGAMHQMSLFALSISPYITASIIIQLLCVAIPSMEEMRKDGKTGEEWNKKVTRYTGIGLAVVQSVAMAAGLGANGLLSPYNGWTVFGASLIWTVGAGILILIGELIDKLHIGNGISIILVCNILAGLPSDVQSVTDRFLSGKVPAVAVVTALVVLAVFLAFTAACVFLNDTAKKIAVTQTRKITGFANSNFPIPLNTCGVMPVIFASSIMSFPLVLAQFLPAMREGIFGHIISCLNSSMWFRPETPWYTVGALLYLGLTTFFTYFYLGIGFNPLEIANNLKTSGTVIPGIRPGKPTAEFIEKLSKKIALIGNLFTTGMILLMHLICNVSGIGSLSIAGTSIIICVSVIMEEKKLFSALETTRKRRVKGFLSIPAAQKKGA